MIGDQRLKPFERAVQPFARLGVWLQERCIPRQRKPALSGFHILVQRQDQSQLLARLERPRYRGRMPLARFELARQDRIHAQQQRGDRDDGDQDRQHVEIFAIFF